MVKIYLGLGSNLGDRRKNIKKALFLLEKEGIKINKISSLFKNKPEEGVKGGYFLNGVVEVETELSPQELLLTLQKIEALLGRKGKHKMKEARTIDLDILLYGNLNINQPNLIIPHPKWKKRDFVLKPLSEIAPGKV